MSALSRYLMVTGGNVTGLTDELEQRGPGANATAIPETGALVAPAHDGGRAQGRSSDNRAANTSAG